MTRLALLILCAATAGNCASATGNASFAAPARGNLLELHSCEVYAGGCIVSSQATLEGRYLLRAWNLTGGTSAGTPLNGLSVALLQSSSENLATRQASADQAVLYLPASASAAQRSALAAWVESSVPELKGAKVHQRVVPITFKSGANGSSFSAGEFISVQTGSLDECKTGACGEALWYTPRTPTSVFTVALNRVSKIQEPLLSLTWRDAGKRSVFLGRFGPEHLHQQFVSLSDLCGPGGLLF